MKIPTGKKNSGKGVNLREDNYYVHKCTNYTRRLTTLRGTYVYNQQ